jgi:diguanylate cyclase (GGDEF)-like protein/PAS domain S-box-containing protein
VARLAEAFAATSVAMLIADSHGGIEYANDAFLRLSGRAPGSPPPRTLSDIAAGGDLRLAASRGGGAGAFTGDVRLARADGTVVPCAITVSPIARPDGGTDGVVIALTDVSARRAEEEALFAAIRRLEEQTTRDFLTGLYNRAYLFEILDRERSRAVRYGQPLAVLMVDLDDFKRVNDDHGHDAGDALLRMVATALKSAVREGDVLARYGGDEFCVLLPNTDASAGIQVAERMRAQVAALKAPPLGLGVDASVGLATTADAPDEPPDGVLRRADAALLAAKRLGGARVERYAVDPEAMLRA